MNPHDATKIHSDQPSDDDDGSDSGNEHTLGKPVTDPRRCDVLFGRGKPFQAHPGNRRLHELADTYKTEYLSARRSVKKKITLSIVSQIKSQYGGRFLRLCKAGNHKWWVEVDDREARVKVCHTIRSRPRESNDEERLSPTDNLVPAEASLPKAANGEEDSKPSPVARKQMTDPKIERKETLPDGSAIPVITQGENLSPDSIETNLERQMRVIQSRIELLQAQRDQAMLRNFATLPGSSLTSPNNPGLADLIRSNISLAADTSLAGGLSMGSIGHGISLSDPSSLLSTGASSLLSPGISAGFQNELGRGSVPEILNQLTGISGQSLWGAQNPIGLPQVPSPQLAAPTQMAQLTASTAQYQALMEMEQQEQLATRLRIGQRLRNQALAAQLSREQAVILGAQSALFRP